MSKKHNLNTISFEESVMGKITSGEIKMKPKWYFIFGSIATIFGLTSLGIVTTFLFSLIIFLFRQHGPNYEWRLQLMLTSFPIWIPIMAIVGIVIGLYLLKQYDFSYRHNSSLILLSVILSLIFAAFAIDALGLNDYWARGPMKRFYQNLAPKQTDSMSSPQNGRNHNGLGRNQYNRLNF